MITKEMLSTKKIKIIIFGSAGLLVLIILFFIVVHFIQKKESISPRPLENDTIETQVPVENVWETNTWSLFTWNNWTWNFILDWANADSWEIVSRSTIREKLKHVPVSETNWVPITSAE